MLRKIIKMDTYDIFNVYAVGAADLFLILKSCGSFGGLSRLKVKASAAERLALCLRFLFCLLSAALTVSLCFGIAGAAEGALFTALYHRSGFLPRFGHTVIVTAVTLAAAYFALKPIKKIALSEAVPKGVGVFIPLFLILLYRVSGGVTEMLCGGTVSTECLPPVSVHIRALLTQLLCLGALLSAEKLYVGLAVRDLERWYAEKAEELYRNTVSFRHDIKNHLTVIDSLLKKGCGDKAAEYAEKLCGKCGELSFVCTTGVAAVDALLERKFSAVSELGIRVDCTLKLPQELTADIVSLCTIFGCAADNALSGCKRAGGGFISLSGRRLGNMFFIVMENSSLGNGFDEGIGLKNIRRAAEKYGGGIIAENSGGIFALTVVFDISRL